MFVRFVVDEIDEYSGVELGIFQAMYRLWRAGKLNRAEEAWWGDVRAWFNLKLDEPDRLALLALDGTGPFGPAERPMGGYVSLPEAWGASEVEPWAARSLAHVSSLPAKIAKPKPAKSTGPKPAKSARPKPAREK